MSLTADDIVKLFENIATKRDIELVREGLRKEIEGLRRDIEELRREIGQLRERVSKVEGQLSLLIKLFIAFNLPILIALIGILLKMIFTP